MRKYFFITLIGFASLATTKIVYAQQPGVAINTNGNAPHSSAMLDIQSTDKGILIPRMTTAQRTAISNLAKGLLVFDNTTSSFWFYNGTIWEELRGGGNSDSQWETSSNAIFNKNTGNVGVGINTPFEKLDVDGNLKLTGGGRLLRMETSQAGPSGNFIVNRYTPGIQFIRSTGTVLGKMEYVDTLNYSNFLRFYTGSTPTHDLTISTDHNVGIGTPGPEAKLHISGGTEQLRIHRVADPILQFTTGLSNAQNRVGFIQMSGADLRLGTNAENDAGRFIVRTGGVNRIVTATNGNVGIGTEDPLTPLHVNGIIFSEGSVISRANMEAEGSISFGGELRRFNTGSVNLAPYAYGVVDGNGTIRSGSGNFSVSMGWDLGRYTITCSGVGTNACVVVTAMNSGDYGNATWRIIDANTFQIDTGGWDPGLKDSIAFDCPFSFVVYKP